MSGKATCCNFLISMSLCSAAQMCLTSLTTCNSIHATAPHEYPTRRPLQVLWGGGLRRRRRTYALHTPIDWRKLVALPATTQAQPRRSRGCESPFSASSPSILARCCCRRRTVVPNDWNQPKKITLRDFTNFSNQVSANSLDIRFRSLQVLYFQNVSKCCSHKYNQSISRVF